jgi:hypothetical protein
VTLELIRTIRCDNIRPDGEQCDHASGAPIEQPTVALLRAHLKTRGWHRTKAGDICPDCWTSTHSDPKDPR